MNNKMDWDLIIKYLEDNCSRDEEQKIESWIKSDSKNTEMFNQVKIIWQTPEVQIPKPDLEKHGPQ